MILKPQPIPSTKAETLLRTPFVDADMLAVGEKRFVQILPRMGAAVLAKQGDKYLLMEALRPVIEQTSWEISRGGIDEGEEPATTAIRELYEETGLTATIDNLKYLGTIFPDTGLIKAEIHIFLAENVTGEAVIAEDEGCGFAWLSKSEIVDNIKAGVVKDSITIAALGLELLVGE